MYYSKLGKVWCFVTLRELNRSLLSVYLKFLDLQLSATVAKIDKEFSDNKITGDEQYVEVDVDLIFFCTKK